MPVVVSTTHLLLLRYSNGWSCWGVKTAGEWIRFSCYLASCRVDRQVSKKKNSHFLGGIWFDCLCDLFLQVPMMHGATPATVSAATTSATSVPFATATANQVCLPPAPPTPPHSIYRRIATKYIFSLASALTFFSRFGILWFSCALLKRKMHKWCTGLIPALCSFLTAFIYSGIHCLALYRSASTGMLLVLTSTAVSVFFFLCPHHWLFPPSGFSLSHRFQLYLQTTWLVTSMLRRCRTLTLNGMCPLVVSTSTVHKLLLVWWLEIAWPL